jgi:hypothetical protein
VDITATKPASSTSDCIGCFRKRAIEVNTNGKTEVGWVGEVILIY